MTSKERKETDEFVDTLYDKFSEHVGGFLNNEGSAVFLLQVIKTGVELIIF